MLLETMLEAVESKLGIESKTVGTVSIELLAKLEAKNEALDEQRETFEAKAKALQAKHEAELEALQAEADAAIETIRDQHDAFWSEVCADLYLDPDGEYAINSETGEVVQRIIPPGVSEKIDEIIELMNDEAPLPVVLEKVGELKALAE